VYGVLLRGSQNLKVLLIQENKLRPMLLSQHHPQAWSVTWLEAIRLHNPLGLTHVINIIKLKPWPRQDQDGRDKPSEVLIRGRLPPKIASHLKGY